MSDTDKPITPAEAFRLGLENERHFQEKANAPMTATDRKVIIASSLGTVFEWYDFYLYGSLAVIIGAKFFSQYDEATRNVFALLAFAAGFIVRPFGAVVFGGLGDRIGRKQTFLITIILMGASTFIVGVLPGSDSWLGFVAPVLLIVLRLLQGLALGGEYGGAATYVAEHAPNARRGYYTSYIQTTATAGLFLSLLVILGCRTYFGEAAFADYGWRVPFLMSGILLLVSIWIRLQLQESPAYLLMRAQGGGSKTPRREAFGQWKNAKWGLIALFGMTMGQGVVWYTGQFYSLFYLGSVLKLDGYTTNVLMLWALALGCPFFVVFGILSDRIGRKPIILGGCALAALVYFPGFWLLSNAANPDLARAHHSIEVVLEADPATCSFQFNPVGTAEFTSGCDVAKAALARASVNFRVEAAAAGAAPVLRIAGQPMAVGGAEFPSFLGARLAAVGYPAASNPSVVKITHPLDVFRLQVAGVILVLWSFVLLVTMVYGPIAAALVELFPTRIRYTGMSLPYHIGNGWFGGLLPATCFALVAAYGGVLDGLWYPVIVAAACAVIGLVLLPETANCDMTADDKGPNPP